LKLKIDKKSCFEIARRSRGTPKNFKFSVKKGKRFCAD